MESDRPLPTYPERVPDDLIREFERRTGRSVLCNRPYSGTEVLKDYGEEHMKTGALIVYTSADSVFQVAAHEQIVPVNELYRYCEIAREMLTGEHSVGRVIARPFVGTCRRRISSARQTVMTSPSNRCADRSTLESAGKVTRGR